MVRSFTILVPENSAMWQGKSWLLCSVLVKQSVGFTVLMHKGESKL